MELPCPHKNKLKVAINRITASWNMAMSYTNFRFESKESWSDHLTFAIIKRIYNLRDAKTSAS
jgi:hypothetical protein